MALPIWAANLIGVAAGQILQNTSDSGLGSQFLSSAVDSALNKFAKQQKQEIKSNKQLAESDKFFNSNKQAI